MTAGLARCGLMLAAAVLAAAGCASLPVARTPPPPSSPPAALLRVHDPGHVTGTVTGPCYARDAGLLPDPRCTPGSYDPVMTRAVLCSASTRAYRPPASETSAAKWNVIVPAYGLPGTFRGELDHLIPLELGGANDMSNLWPEAGPVPNAKDRTENALHHAVCAGEMPLAAAQAAIAADWQTAGP